MTTKRFAAFWLVDYIIGFVVVYTLVYGVILFEWPAAVRNAYVVLVPLLTLFFSWVAFHGTTKEPAHRYFVAALWVGLSIVVDLLITVLYYQLSPMVILTSMSALFTYAFQFLVIVLAGTLSRRSASASLPSPDLLPPAQG